MLEPVRQYALTKLKLSSEEDTLQRRHATFYAVLADVGKSRNVYDEPPERWSARMRMEQENVRRALTWTESAKGTGELGLRLLRGLDWELGDYTQAQHLMERGLAHAEMEAGYEPLSRAHVLFYIGNISAFRGLYLAAQSPLLASLKWFRELGEHSWAAAALERLGWIAREQGDTATAIPRLEEALVLARQGQDKLLVANLINTLAQAILMDGDIGRAKSMLQENLVQARQFGYTTVVGWALNHLGHAAQIEGDYEAAAKLHADSFSALGGEEWQWLGTAEAHFSLGETALAQGDAKRAAMHLGKSLNMSRDLGYRTGVAWSLASLAGVAFLIEEPERAALLWGAAEHMRQSIGARRGPATDAMYERLKAHARHVLGDKAFNRAWAEGESMASDKAIAIASGVATEVESRMS